MITAELSPHVNRATGDPGYSCVSVRPSVDALVVLVFQDIKEQDKRISRHMKREIFTNRQDRFTHLDLVALLTSRLLSSAVNHIRARDPRPWKEIN